MKAVILAAGFATRMYPLTRDRAKPLLEVAGRPVLSHLVDRVRRLPELDEIAVVTNARFHADFVAWRDAYPSPVPIRLVDDGAHDAEHRRGGVTDLALALGALATRDDAVFVAAGDNLIDFELVPFAAAFRARGTPLVLARTLTPPIPPRRFGEIEVDADGIITRFREKPDAPRSPLAATCLYFFPPEVLHELDVYLDGGGDRDAPGRFIAWLAARRPVSALPYVGTCFDIGNLESLERARLLYRP